MIHDIGSQQESSEVSSGLRVGALDWQHEHWQSVFYPDDLPQDWRLGFYANEFSTVLVPQSRWLAALDEIEDWLDVPDNFGFYLVLEDERYRLQLETVMQRLKNRLLGVFLPADIPADIALIEMQSQDLRAWRKWLEQHGNSLKAVFLKDEELSIQQLNDFKSLVEWMQL